ncbi:MAG: SIR2 family protein [Planctomycetia bacterium]|nr:SIR2 family protein [Planctomycetia bacterium]
MSKWKAHKYRVGPDQKEYAEAPADEKLLKELRGAVEPWLTAVFQSEHLSVLLGSGFSAGIAGCGGKKFLSMSTIELDAAFKDQVNADAARSAKASGRGAPNVEDQLSSALRLLDGLRIAGDPKADAWGKSLDKILAGFATEVLKSEAEVAKILNDPSSKAYSVLMGFLMSFASRAASRERLNIFTTNYDRLLEHAFDLLGVRAIDRFVGSLVPEFRSSRQNIDYHYNPPGVRGEPRYLEGVVRLAKLHGSIDWQLRDRRLIRRPLPFGAPTSHSEFPTAALTECMIYPNAAKDYETLFFPYAELFRDFAAAICQPNSTLVTYGYGFGDDHVNRVIRDMLTIPSTHLVIISFDSAGGRIEAFLDGVQREAQVSLLIGSHFGGIESLVNNYLPKSAIDQVTFRKALLLERRGDRSPVVRKEGDDAGAQA